MNGIKFSFGPLPFGKAPFIILLTTLLSGGYLILNPIEDSAVTLRLWTFASNHLEPYQKAVPSFEMNHPGSNIDVQLVHGDAVNSRLRAAFWADLDVPDLVEIEISRAGSFFRGPSEDVGFIDLLPILKKTGYYDRIVETRFAPYTNRGKIYGLPHDVHPVVLAYRRDLFDNLGINVESIETWDDFIRIGTEVTIPGERYLIELSDNSATHFEIFLFQRDGGYFDREGDLIMDNEVALETLLFFIPMVAGSERIGSDLGSYRLFTQAVEQGYFLSFLCPDWRSKVAESDIPRMSGNMALMPLPAVVPGSRRTSTMGGTMLGITKACPNPELAWKVAEHMYFDKDELGERFRDTNILPPLKEAWSHPAFDESRDYWSGQKLGRIYADLADDVPPQFASPLIEMAKSKMASVISVCSAYYRTNGEKGFEKFARSKLLAAGNEVRRYIDRNPF
jgi:arabinosaccharide transport system substrate-binding protein